MLDLQDLQSRDLDLETQTGRWIGCLPCQALKPSTLYVEFHVSLGEGIPTTLSRKRLNPDTCAQSEILPDSSSLRSADFWPGHSSVFFLQFRGKA